MEERRETELRRLRRLRGERAEQLEELGRLRRDAADDRATIDDLRAGASRDNDELTSLRRRHSEDAEQISVLEAASSEAARVEAAQRALVARLRAEVSDAAREVDAVSESLIAAERELGDLRAIRDALTSPAFVQRDGMTIAAELTPAEPEVGGDFFFVGDGPGGVAVVAVGDVVGKGLTAARRAAFARTALSSVAGFSDDPCQLLRWVNVALVERIGESGDFVTAICLTCDPARRLLRVATAGHHPALSLGSGEELSGARNGTALGLTTAIHCESAEIALDPGEGVLLYTDGVIEARGTHSRYGTDRLRRVLKRSADLDPDRLVSKVCEDLDRFRAGVRGDDVCLVALRVD